MAKARKHPSHQPLGLRVHRLLNPVMRAILHSPLHGMQSHSVLLLSYTGKKSGQRYTIPVGYVEEGEALYILVGYPEQKTWWRNLCGGAPVQLWLRGREVSGYAEVVSSQSEAVVRGLTAYLHRFPHSATIRGMRRGSDGRFAHDEIERAAVDTVMVRITRAASFAERVSAPSREQER